MKIKRHLSGFTLVEILVVMVIIGILLAIAIPTFSRFIPQCRETSCIGYNPEEKGCAQDAITIKKNILQGIEIELRHSLKCKASWARTTAPRSSVIYVKDLQGQKYGQYTIPEDQFQQHYGDMGPGGFELAACLQMPNEEPRCTEES
jgi:prepilin-type N-terminal cleavage/methylation domain-containing protein